MTQTGTTIKPAATLVSIERRADGFYRLLIRPVGRRAYSADLNRTEALGTDLLYPGAAVAVEHADAKAGRPVRLGIELYRDRGRNLTPNRAYARYNPGE